jgi:anti-sigma regulatory factor (Ser/Thr protein kinase)
VRFDDNQTGVVTVSVTASDVVTRYRPDTRSPGEARRAVRAFCAANAIENLSDDAELLASEVMTNACRMADGPVTMFLLADDGALVVIISDDCADRLPATPTLSPPTAESGRGVFVLDQLAGSWGATSTNNGKNVWFRLP